MSGRPGRVSTEGQEAVDTTRGRGVLGFTCHWAGHLATALLTTRVNVTVKLAPCPCLGMLGKERTAVKGYLCKLPCWQGVTDGENEPLALVLDGKEEIVTV